MACESLTLISLFLQVVRKFSRYLISFKGFIWTLKEKILTDVKKNEPTHQPEKWMADLAIGSVHLKEGNTFVRSLWLHLVKKVSRNFAKVLSGCDLFGGLDHLSDPSLQRHFVDLMHATDLTSVPAVKSTFK